MYNVRVLLTANSVSPQKCTFGSSEERWKRSRAAVWFVSVTMVFTYFSHDMMMKKKSSGKYTKLRCDEPVQNNILNDFKRQRIQILG